MSHTPTINLPFNQIIQQLNDGIIIVSLEGKIIYLNDQMADMLGYVSDEMMGKTLFDFMSPDWAAKAQQNLQKRSEGNDDGFDHQFLTKNNETLWAMVSPRVMQLNNNQIVSVVAIRDITSRIEMEKQLSHERDTSRAALEASGAKSIFLANMSHELRTPLNAIIGYIELILEEELNAPKEEIIGDLSRVKRAAYHLLGLINNVLDLAKVEAGRMEVHASTFPLVDLLEEVQQITAPLTKKNHNALIVENGLELYLYQDRLKLKQILINLLGNACKFTKNGTITLKVSNRDDDHIRFEIIDTGKGISKPMISKLFEPFIQSNNSDKGTGLGLTICKHYCDMMGGSLQIESQLGQGSRFWVDLPISM